MYELRCVRSNTHIYKVRTSSITGFKCERGGKPGFILQSPSGCRSSQSCLLSQPNRVYAAKSKEERSLLKWRWARLWYHLDPSQISTARVCDPFSGDPAHWDYTSNLDTNHQIDIGGCNFLEIRMRETARKLSTSILISKHQNIFQDCKTTASVFAFHPSPTDISDQISFPLYTFIIYIIPKCINSSL